MAIDFMVMPLSRYLAGDFITPVMRLSWDNDLPYVIIGPDGKREFPVGVPYGGVDAAAKRRGILDNVISDLREMFDGATDQVWDEASSTEPCFHRVDPSSFGVLQTYAQASLEEPRGWFRRRAPTPLNLAAEVFLPCEFPAPFLMQSPFVNRVTGSAPVALRELASPKIPAGAAVAIETLRAALEDAVRLRLPMVVDA